MATNVLSIPQICFKHALVASFIRYLKYIKVKNGKEMYNFHDINMYVFIKQI